MKNRDFIIIVLLVLILLTGCTAGPNSYRGIPDGEGNTAGFLLGVWHGAISFITFIISLFNDKVSVYEVHNNGGWYNLGFILGITIAYGSSGKTTGCGRRKRKF